jgi:hypothetical protein
VVTFGIEGLRKLDVHPFGPDQAYVVPPEDVRLSVPSAHCGELLVAVAVGKGLTVIDPVAVILPQPPVKLIV